MCHILHGFVVLFEAKLSAKPQTSAIYGRIMHEYGIQYLINLHPPRVHYYC